jgi:hypothetical protein
MRTLVDPFEIIPSSIPAPSRRSQYRSKQRTLLDAYELCRTEPRLPPYRSKQRTVPDPFELRSRSS